MTHEAKMCMHRCTSCEKRLSNDATSPKGHDDNPLCVKCRE